ncbi:MAG: polyprenol monophosphomannose synthase [Candidatus Pacebacteria bacterium]|nr:polyprenol monophosphomannose synthase [Candidatus Paceibacterota bacterium]
MSKLSLIIATYNEENNIVETLERSHKIMQSISVPHELIVVDDASKDKTREQVENLQKTIPEIILIKRDNERGLATALIAGYNRATGDYLGSMDADLTAEPELLEKMVNLLNQGQADFVIGSRYVPGAEFKGKPLLNKMASLVGQRVAKIILGIKITDTSNNFRVFKKQVWEKIKDKLHPDGNVMIMEIAYLAYKNGFKIKEIPIIYIERRVGKSKLSVFKETIKFFKNIIKIKNGS